MNDIDFEQELYKHFGQVKDFTLGMRIGKYLLELGQGRGGRDSDAQSFPRGREREGYYVLFLLHL